MFNSPLTDPIWPLDVAKAISPFVNISKALTFNNESSRTLSISTLLISLEANTVSLLQLKIATAITSVGGSYVPAPITIDLTSAKNETIKTG